MNIETLKLIYFSPTGTTKRVLEGIAGAIQPAALEYLDLTPPESKTRRFEELRGGLMVLGTPVYGGRVPPDAVRRLRRLKASNTPAILVVVYGNRDYEDALLELHDLAVEIGFRPAAAGVFIGEHALMPVADGRPDAKDLEKAEEFGKKIRDKLDNYEKVDNLPPLKIPGKYPYVEKKISARDILKTFPVTDETLCVKCGSCTEVCPTASVTLNDRVITDTGECILCCACVVNCPTGARRMDAPRYRPGAGPPSKEFSGRKEPEIFI
jgi:ferredoxin